MFYTARPLCGTGLGYGVRRGHRALPLSQRPGWPLCSYQMCALLCKGKDMPDAEGSVALTCPNLWTQKTFFILGIKHSTSR